MSSNHANNAGSRDALWGCLDRTALLVEWVFSLHTLGLSRSLCENLILAKLADLCSVSVPGCCQGYGHVSDGAVTGADVSEL